jgi:ABC-type polysaccharide/polyol phosphate export permease
MKAIGICLIVWGHSTRTSMLFSPIYVKQLGVALFLFATGFTLAREQRPAVTVVFNRMFEPWLFGLTLAALLTSAGAATGSSLALSNFLPFAAGANVAFNHFPANPTTWYLGTYLHLLVVWALLLRHIPIRRWMIVAVVASEVPIRAAIGSLAGPYVAYMLLTNWSSVFLFGLACGSVESPARAVRRDAAIAAVALVAWAIVDRSLAFLPDFPFMTVGGSSSAAGLLLPSVGVSIQYLSSVAIAFAVFRNVDAPAPVRALARNTTIIFLAHMPLLAAVNPVLDATAWTYPAKVLARMVLGVAALAVLSELIRRLVKPARLRDRVFTQLSGWPMTDLREMVREQFEYHELLVRMTMRDLLLRYKQTAMGFAWAIFMPLVNTAIFSVIFTRVAKVDVGVPYPLYAFLGLLTWNFFASSLRFSVTSLTGNPSLVTKVYFPREIFPFSAVIVSLVDFAVASPVLIGLMAYYGVGLSWSVAAVPLVIAVHVVFTAAVALLLSMANLFYRDVKYLFEIVISIWMFVSSVLYPIDRIGGWMGVALQLNPMTRIIDAYRATLLLGRAPDAAFLATAAASAAFLVVSWLAFHVAEFKFAENI